MAMLVNQIDLVLLDLELRFPFETGGTRITRKHSVLVRVHDSDGNIGYGEAPVFDDAWYTRETTASVMDALEHQCFPLILSAPIESAVDLTRLLNQVAGNPTAKASLEGAFCHLQSMRDTRSISRLWGEPKPQVQVGISLGIEADVSVLLERIARALDAGYRRVKLKIKPGRDVASVRAVRERFGDIPISVDANGSYSYHEDPVWSELDALALVMIEQPFPAANLLDHARLQQRISTPICLDESITSPERAGEAIAADAARVLCLKPTHLGGYRTALDVATFARAHGLSTWVGGMLETGIGKAMAVHLAAQPAFDMPADISATDRYYVRDVLSSPIRVDDGSIQVPTVPGLGWEIDRSAIEALTVSDQTFTAV
jgi:O-succinylbenzoate synthase